jgi:phosphonate metabolism protein PhnN/1,5-bisphosphokinase (PRPP-forming)
MICAVVGPSGAGKDTLIAGAVAARPQLHWVRRMITRPADAGGEAHEPATDAAFDAALARGDLALWWAAHGLRYGIPRAEVEGRAEVIFNGSRAALPAARAAFPDLRVIVVTAPEAVLAARLSGRGREGAEAIAGRLTRAAYALPAGITATVVMNDGSVEQGVARLLAALQPVSA